MAADRRVRAGHRDRVRGKGGRAGFPVAVAVVGVLPIITGCSAFSSWSSSSSVPPPPAYPPAAAAQPPYSPAVAGGAPPAYSPAGTAAQPAMPPGYPPAAVAQPPYSPAVAGAAPPAYSPAGTTAQPGATPMPLGAQTASAAPDAPSAAPPPAQRSFTEQMGDTLNRFRDPTDSASTIDEARPMRLPQPPQPPQPQPAMQPYPSQPITDLFKDNTPPPQSTAVPHPPGTYYPADGAPVAGQPAGTAGAPSPYTPSGQQAAASAPAPAPTDAPSNGAYPSKSLFDFFRSGSSGQ